MNVSYFTRLVVFMFVAAMLAFSPLLAQSLLAQGAQPAAVKPSPRFPDGSINLGITPEEKGLWLPRDRTELGRRSTLAPVESIPFQPWARELYDDRQIHELEPHTRCKASLVARQ